MRKRTQGASVTFQKQSRLVNASGDRFDQERMLSASEYFELLSTYADPLCAEVTQSLPPSPTPTTTGASCASPARAWRLSTSRPRTTQMYSVWRHPS